MRASSRLRGGLGIVVAALLLSAPVASAVPADQPAAPGPGDPVGNNWSVNGGNYFNQRYSGLDQINTTNVANLKGAWTYHTGGNNSGTSFESTPIVVDGTMYLTGPQSEVYALDATDGQEKWRFAPDLSDIGQLPLCCGQDNRGVAVGGGKVFVAQLDAKLTALDAASGSVIWSVQDDDPRAGYSETMAPLFWNGMVFLGSSGAEYEIRGHVTAYDANSGQQVWRFYTIPGPGEFGNDTWPAGTDMWKFGGGSVWQTPALDPDLGMLYIAVGNPAPDLDGSQRAGDNLFTESIVALDAKTGTRKWHYQEIHHDLWDYDAVSPDVLFDVQMNGKTVKGLGQTGKTGWIYLLDRTNGMPLVGIDEKQVPQIREQNTAATQPFPIGDSFVPQACTTDIGSYPTAGIFTPFKTDPILMCPGANGGSEWSSSSYNQKTNFMYACGIHQPQIWTGKPDQITPGTLRLGSAFVTPPGGETWGTLTAIDVRTNRKAWQVQTDQMCIGGTMTTAGGLVFGGEGNGNFDAYDATSGQRLWQFQTGAGANAPAMTYMVGGDQYVAVAAGGNFQLDFPRGDALWVFSLKGTMAPVAAPPAPVSQVASTARSVTSVTVEDFDFNPGVFGVAVPPGTTITWSNNGPTQHTTTADNGTWDSGLLDAGQSFSFTFNDPGVYWYFCRPHPWMRGTITIDPNAPTPQGGAAVTIEQ
ncbi:MAG: PQQ-binding-like beta-propeller repeat protein [Chloroflexi bacterium]|nr:PQQ-binding-like beta-propeller repeat protein [Chloroflexota bacterium]